MFYTQIKGCEKNVNVSQDRTGGEKILFPIMR
jgi:hypothetical protein